MGICFQENDPSNIELEKIIVANNDFSFIYTVLQAFFNLNTFKKFILADKSKKEKKNLGESLKKIFQKDINKDLIKNSKLIYYRIKKINNDNVGIFPSNILIQILDILNKEQRSKENENINNKELLLNIQNKLNSNNYNDEQRSFYKYLESLANTNNNNKIGELFYIFFQNKIINNFQMINNTIYEHKFVFQLNLYDIFRIKSNNGTLTVNNKIPQLSLKECIQEYSAQKNINYNCIQCIQQKFLCSTSAYLIFILNRKGNPHYYYFGNFIYSNIIDLSSVILREDSAKKYKISSIIKEKKIVPEINDEQESEENYNFNYITINTDNNGNFYYYDNNQRISTMFNNNKYFEHILIFKQEKG